MSPRVASCELTFFARFLTIRVNRPLNRIKMFARTNPRDLLEQDKVSPIQLFYIDIIGFFIFDHGDQPKTTSPRNDGLFIATLMVPHRL